VYLRVQAFTVAMGKEPELVDAMTSWMDDLHRVRQVWRGVLECSMRLATVARAAARLSKGGRMADAFLSP